MFLVKIDGRRMCSVRGANGGRDREEGPNAATSAAKLQRARPFKRVCLASHCSLMTPLLQARKTLRKGGPYPERSLGRDANS